MSSRSRRVAAGLLVGAAFGLGVAATSFTAAAASGATPCPAGPEGATLVSGTTCQLILATAGETTVTLPAGITKLSAVLLGGGGGGYETAGLGGGAGGTVGEHMTFPTSTNTSVVLDVIVGAGGAAGEFTEFGLGGEQTSVRVLVGGVVQAIWGKAGGAGASFDPASSGNAFDGSALGGGGGSAADATGAEGGAGYATLSALVSAQSGLDAELWSDLSGLGAYTSLGFGGDGGREPATVVRGPGSGGHARVQIGVDGEGDPILASQAGSAGLVVLRYAYVPEAPVDPAGPVIPAAEASSVSELAKTGGSAPGALIALGGATTLAGAAMLAVTRRRKQS